MCLSMSAYHPEDSLEHYDLDKGTDSTFFPIFKNVSRRNHIWKLYMSHAGFNPIR